MTPQEALVQAMNAIDGFPAEDELGEAGRILEQLGRLGFEVVKRDTIKAVGASGSRFAVSVYPCRCPAPCIAHPFGTVRRPMAGE